MITQLANSCGFVHFSSLINYGWIFLIYFFPLILVLLFSTYRTIMAETQDGMSPIEMKVARQIEVILIYIYIR